MKSQTAGALSRLKTGGEDYTDNNNGTAVDVGNPIEDFSKAHKTSSNTVCQISDNNRRKPET